MEDQRCGAQACRRAHAGQVAAAAGAETMMLAHKRQAVEMSTSLLAADGDRSGACAPTPHIRRRRGRFAVADGADGDAESQRAWRL